MNTATQTTDLRQQAIDFAAKYQVKLTIAEPKYGQMGWDKNDSYRWIFPCRLTRNKKHYSFKFGQSIAAGSEYPDMYDVLACLTKYDPETFEFFCSNYGYDTDSRTAEKTYKAVCKEWVRVERLFADVLDELREIN